LDEEDLQDRRKEQAYAAVREFQSQFAPLNKALRDVNPRAEIDVMDDKLTNNTMKSLEYAGAPEIAFRWQRCSRLGAGPEHFRYTLRIGRGLELATTGEVILRAFIDVGYPEIGGNDFDWQSDERLAPAGSVQVDTQIQSLVTELGDQLGNALEVFEERVRSGA
jgi:hypothetical protein